jgi:hypothetical protein
MKNTQVPSENMDFIVKIQMGMSKLRSQVPSKRCGNAETETISCQIQDCLRDAGTNSSILIKGFNYP